MSRVSIHDQNLLYRPYCEIKEFSIRKNNVYEFGGVYNLVYVCIRVNMVIYCGMLGYFLKFYFLDKLVYNFTFCELVYMH